MTAGGDDDKEVTLPPDVARASRPPRPSLPRLPRIARYEILGEVGGGSVGVILAAIDRESGRKVALKVPVADFDHAEIELEARVTAKLDHPAIVRVYDAGYTDCGRPFYAMRLVSRRSLRDVLREEPREEWPHHRLVALLAQVADALAYAHARGVVHRDLKPSNVLVGESDDVYLADWGLARIEPGSDVARPSTDPKGSIIGTPGYVAPEVIAGAEHDHRADLFSFGVILYETLTRTRPFRRATPEETLAATRAFDPPHPSEGGDLADLCMRLLAKEPADRVDSAADVAHFLRGRGIP